MVTRRKIQIRGRVQGVGFRPAVYRAAKRLALTGFVYNDSLGVTIEIQGPAAKIKQFTKRLEEEMPPLAEIKRIQTTLIGRIEKEEDFIIKESRSAGAAGSEVTADIGVCKKCLQEMNDAADFRYRYPFINCTNCGPRYSIVKMIPYDRVNTTMSVFKMCGRCAGQYREPANRRFHAQPVACGKCGPKVWLADKDGKIIEAEGEAAVAKTALLLKAGRVVGIKGVGGFHLAVDALNEKAVEKLRQRKRREHKPFAMMTDSIEKVRRYAVVSKEAEEALKSPECPIVLLEKREGAAIAKAVAEGTNTFGFMLCYAPLHYLLFGEGLEALVMTSGNISDEPLICDNEKAIKRLGNIADAFLMHGREIYRQVDDSIVHFLGGQEVLLRRSRGYVPSPITMGIKGGREILAAGADLKNTFCLVKGEQFIVSEHIGDLADAEVFGHYTRAVEHFGRLFEFEAELVVCDLHPNYLSTQYALSQKGVEVMQVQHHWAHIASVLAENGIEGPVIGIAADGTGYGTDGANWGCECLISSLEGFERFGHLDYYELPGGDAAGREAIRPAIGLLKQAYGEEFNLKEFGHILDKIETGKKQAEIIQQQIERRINTVETSSMGRVFDAVAAMSGLGSINRFEAQLPMLLESVAAGNTEERYDYEIIFERDKPIRLDLRKMIRQIVSDIKKDTACGVISARFHNCVAAGLSEMAECAREKTGISTVAISGGVFCNRYLAGQLIKLLQKKDFGVLFNRLVPANDGGISVGQAAIAAWKTKM
jgi:hydrogenase maturation protein HypF